MDSQYTYKYILLKFIFLYWENKHSNGSCSSIVLYVGYAGLALGA